MSFSPKTEAAIEALQQKGEAILEQLPKRIKYVICPGQIASKMDRELHYITADRLVNLYGVNPAECHVRGTAPKEVEAQYDELPHLRPRYNGDYREHIEYLNRIQG